MIINSLGYSVIKESDIPESILAFASINHGIKDTKSFSKWHSFHKNQKGSNKFCPIYNDSTKDVSLHPREDMVEKSFLEVMPGGRWIPLDCTPQIKGSFTGYVNVETDNLKIFLFHPLSLIPGYHNIILFQFLLSFRIVRGKSN